MKLSTFFTISLIIPLLVGVFIYRIVLRDPLDGVEVIYNSYENIEITTLDHGLK